MRKRGMTTTRIALLVVALAACGGAPGPSGPLDTAREQQPHAVSPHAAPGSEHDALARLPPAVSQFHDVLAPRWHADKGPQRMADTCAAIGDFRSGAQAIAAAEAPAGSDEAAWQQATADLASSVTALDGACKVKDAEAFEPAFERVHASFHRVMDGK